MTKTITATFEDGVLKPTEPLDLPDCTEVRLTVEYAPDSVKVQYLNDLLRSLPKLGDDAEDFANDLRAIRAQFRPVN